MNKHKTFQELTTKACDMEMAIANRHDKASSFPRARKDEANFKKKILSPPRARPKNRWQFPLVNRFGFLESQSRRKDVLINKRCWKKVPYIKGVSRKELPIP